MYNFSPQKEMFGVARKILQTINVLDYALGGGTALSAYHWNHRYSTDIDIFLFEKHSHMQHIREAMGKPYILQSLKQIGYQGNMKYPGHYLEIEIDAYKKIQFFESKQYRPNAYVFHHLWGYNTNIECVDEIIYKKIFYRGEKCNTRDIFDIAVAVHKDPLLFETILAAKPLFIDNLMALEYALKKMLESIDEMVIYKTEVEYISPATNYKHIAYLAPQYLCDYLEAFLIMFRAGALNNNLLIALEKEVYKETVKK